MYRDLSKTDKDAVQQEIQINEIKNNQQNSYKYKKETFISEGGFGKVYTYSGPNNKLFAVKVIDLNKDNSNKSIEQAENEIKILKKMNHPNIIKYYFDIKIENKLYIFMELCQNRSLKELSMNRSTISEEEVKYYLIKIISGL